MTTTQYLERRGELEDYFDRTAVAAWSQLTSDAPVGRIRATVRAGREEMRHALLSWLPSDLRGARLLDAGCGTGALSVEAARRGADVVAVDISPTLIGIARSRLPVDVSHRAVRFVAGDMLNPALGKFDFTVAMDSVIHYQPKDAMQIVAGFAARTLHSLLVTFAPKTPALTLMHAVGRAFPRENRAPAIEPISEHCIRLLMSDHSDLEEWSFGRSKRIASGFYKSHALELLRS